MESKSGISCRDKINYENQLRLERYIFGNYKFKDITISTDIITVQFGDEGEKTSENPNYFQFKYKYIDEDESGVIFKIFDENKKVALALKKSDDDNEKAISIQTLKSNCNVLKMRLIGSLNGQLLFSGIT